MGTSSLHGTAHLKSQQQHLSTVAKHVHSCGPHPAVCMWSHAKQHWSAWVQLAPQGLEAVLSHTLLLLLELDRQHASMLQHAISVAQPWVQHARLFFKAQLER